MLSGVSSTSPTNGLTTFSRVDHRHLFVSYIQSLPYVHFTGPKGSGKSQCLHVLRNLCHNGKIAGSMTLPCSSVLSALCNHALVRRDGKSGQTQHTELHRMLKYGFEKNGPQVWRMDMTGNRMEMSCWSVYCPRAFASIEGMEDVIGSRSVQVIMERHSMMRLRIVR